MDILGTIGSALGITPSSTGWFPDASRSLAAGGSELEALLGRAQAGQTLTPVENGTLARLMDIAAARAGAGGPVNSTTVEARADGGDGGSDPVGGVDAGGATAGATDAGATTGPGKTAADFTVLNGTPQDIADLNAALSYLQSTNANGSPMSPTAVALLNALPEGANINIVHNGQDQYDGAGTIDWDPRSGLIVTSGEGTQSPALGLAHEIDHEVAGQANPVDTHDGYENSEEQRVIQGSETTIANDFHEPTRTDHDGEATNMGSATDHSYWNNNIPPPFSPDIPGLGDGSPPTGDVGGTISGDTGGTTPAPSDPPPFSPDIPGLGDGGGDVGGGDPTGFGNTGGSGGEVGGSGDIGGGDVGGGYFGGGDVGGGGEFDTLQLESE